MKADNTENLNFWPLISIGVLIVPLLFWIVLFLIIDGNLMTAINVSSMVALFTNIPFSLAIIFINNSKNNSMLSLLTLILCFIVIIYGIYQIVLIICSFINA